ITIFVFALAAFSCLLLFTGCKKAKLSAETDPHKYLSFELQQDDTYEVTGFTSAPVKDPVVPAFHNGKRVDAVAPNAFSYYGYGEEWIHSGIYLHGHFSGWNLTKLEYGTVTIENGIRIIGNNFIHVQKGGTFLCTAQRIILPDSVEYIGDYAFNGTGAEINYPSSVKKVGAYAFSNSKLYGDIMLKGEEISVGAFSHTHISSVDFSVPYDEIPQDCFFGCRSLKEVTLSVADTSLGKKFAYCPIEKINLNGAENAFLSGGCLVVEENDEKILVLGSGNYTYSDEITKIGEYAFSGRKFTADEVKFRVENIEEFAFYGAVANEIYAEVSDTVGGQCFYGVACNVLTVKAGKLGANSVCCKAKKLKILTEDIDAFQFHANYPEIEELELMEGCKRISNYAAFANCATLKKLILPASMQEIAKPAFQGCGNLTEIYYDLKAGKPLYLDAEIFCYNDTVFKPSYSNGRFTLYTPTRMINDKLKIYVYDSVSESCKSVWSHKAVVHYGMDEIVLPALSERVKIRND
ncbi:MAG: leucine-rich repeat protein, partial [Clostridia bacterium]|nr:leucine-rich repeat protein [Clostridia bacterium]